MPELETRARAVLATMIEQIRRSDELDPVFQFWAGEQCDLQKMPPQTKVLMNSGPGKDEIFRFFRRHVGPRGIDTCVFGSDTWVHRTTDSAMKRHTPEQLGKLVSELPLETLVELGLMERFEALTVLAQDATEALHVTQFYVRNPAFRLCGPPHMQRIPQAKFSGRMKMYGDLRPEKLFEHGAR